MKVDRIHFRQCGQFFVFFFLLLILGCTSGTNEEAPVAQEPLFKKLLPSQTGISFINRLSEHPSPNRNELLFEYFSNGAGVAVGDVNGDGLDDLFFTANMGYNQLYLNQGELRFQDISDIAGIKGRVNTWKTGVAMADVNGDGLQDVYVCYSGDLPTDRRIDELYINQGAGEDGVPRFVESAAAYGLGQPHSSNQPYFFDYDQDGDLDLFLLTHNVERIPRLIGEEARRALSTVDTMSGVRLYRNEGEQFVDVTTESGISNSSLTYGLGAGVSDVNNDGWLDLYVGNDYFPPDYLYINQGDGTFKDELGERMTVTSRASMGVDIADINNDGLTDVLVLDMLPAEPGRLKTLFIPDDRRLFDLFVQSGFHHQYTRNTLQLNTGDGYFSEIGQLAGISNTDWSWAVLASDFDNDGLKDVFVTNGTLHDTIDRDYLAFQRQFISSKNEDLEPTDVGILMERMPSSDLENYMFKNTGDLQFEDYTDTWGLGGALITTGAAYSDLDNDGDLDLITHNINEYAFVYENRATDISNQSYIQVELKGSSANSIGIGAKVFVHTGAEMQLLEQVPMRGYLSSVSPVLHAGLGQATVIDSLVVQWTAESKQVLRDVPVNQRLVVEQEDAEDWAKSVEVLETYLEEIEPPFSFAHQMPSDLDDYSRQPLLVLPLSDVGPALEKGDVNGDGLDDIFIGGGIGQEAGLFIQNEEGGFDRINQASFSVHKASQDVSALFFDSDNDGDQDLYVVSGGYAEFNEGDEVLQDRLYKNDGQGRFTYAGSALPEMRTSTSIVTAADINQDGFMDLFVGGYVVPGRFPDSPRSYVLINNGAGEFVEQAQDIAPGLLHPGMITDADWTDLNGDGWEELVVVGQWMPIQVYEWNGDSLVDATGEYFDQKYTGLWNTLLVEDVNGDGVEDLVAGNLGLNGQFKASPEEPAVLYSADFDNNGTIDPMLAYSINGELYPHATLGELQSQLPLLGSSITSNTAYGQVSMNALMPSELLDGADVFELTELETSLFIGRQSGGFQKSTLPIEAQFAPVYHITAGSIVNDDNYRDLILVGNTAEGAIRLGKYDASYGVLLRGSRDGFSIVSVPESGLQITQSVRNIVQLEDKFIFGVQGGELVSYQISME